MNGIYRGPPFLPDSTWMRWKTDPVLTCTQAVPAAILWRSRAARPGRLVGRPGWSRLQGDAA